jgi:hypothetical protein
MSPAIATLVDFAARILEFDRQAPRQRRSLATVDLAA